MQRLEMYPFDNPKVKRISMNNRSELMIGSRCTTVVPLCMLHMRKTGMKSVRARDNVRSRLADQIRNIGNEQTYLPRKSPMLKTRKCTALKSRGCTAGFVGCIEVVMGGNTACTRTSEKKD